MSLTEKLTMALKEPKNHIFAGTCPRFVGLGTTVGNWSSFTGKCIVKKDDCTPTMTYLWPPIAWDSDRVEKISLNLFSGMVPSHSCCIDAAHAHVQRTKPPVNKVQKCVLCFCTLFLLRKFTSKIRMNVVQKLYVSSSYL